MSSWFDRSLDVWDFVRERKVVGGITLLLVIWLTMAVVFGVYWSQAPNVQPITSAPESASKKITGYATTNTLITVVETLLNKPGGYLSNDMAPPGIWLDNMPNWEFGVLVQCRDLARALRNDMSRSQSQSTEDKDLAEAEPMLSFSNDSWLFPSTEGEYKNSVENFIQYRRRLVDSAQQTAQFYARADNLTAWLAIIEKRLGSLSQRLSASVGQERVNIDLAGDASASQFTPAQQSQIVKTSWFKIDDEFYEARGTAWALIHFLKAAEYDFADVLAKKNAQVSLRQIILELESTQDTLWSPMVMNGSGFGMFANHSLVMASYLSRANAAVIDLRNLLENG